MSNRFFCMFDTLDVMSKRLVINVQTKTNVQQALAENLCPNLTHEQRLAHANKSSSDYMELVWIKQYGGFECTINIESGEILFTNGDKYTPDQTISMKEYELSHPKTGAYRQLLNACDTWDMNYHKRGSIKLMSKNIHINNTTQVAPDRQEFYARSPINHQIICTMLHHPNITTHTCSRKCDLRVDVACDWRKGTGALVAQSEHNTREHLRHVK